MPYIKADERVSLTNACATVTPQSPGQLSFCLTRVVQGYLDMYGVNYSTLASVAGVLILTFLEFCRRVVFVYEDKKKDDNGDVF